MSKLELLKQRLEFFNIKLISYSEVESVDFRYYPVNELKVKHYSGIYVVERFEHDSFYHIPNDYIIEKIISEILKHLI